MSEVAYGKRNNLKIRLMSLIGLLLIIIKKHGRRIFYPDYISRNVVVIPRIKSEKVLGDLLNRVAWGYPNKTGLHISVLVSKNLINKNLNKLKVPDSQHNYIKNNTSHIKLVDKLPKEKDTFLIHKASSLLNPKNTVRIPRSFVIDDSFFSYTESRTWRDGYWDTLDLDEKSEIIELSKNNFLKLQEETKDFSRSYCFVTGPSFDNYKSYTFEDNSLKIICNSVVKNNDFLDYIKKPHILTFADPVFHFSPNNYSSIFRKEAMECVNKYDPFVVVPLKTAPLLLHYFPALKPKIIGVNWGWNLKFPTANDLEVKHSGNILTYFMIPFASALSEEINVMGADGRQPNENYFWKHSKTAQYDDLMKDVFETHPSFFRDRDYKDYYKNHCDNLEKMIQFGEDRGKRYYSITSSYIPAFTKRFKNNLNKG